MEDGVLLEGKVEECRAAFYAADTSGDGLLGAPSQPHGRIAERGCYCWHNANICPEA
jgi:hypothetical protein